MYTFCPNCFSVYRISPSQLAAAGGKTRCGECRQIYPAVDYLHEDLAAARAALALQRSSPGTPDVVTPDIAPAAEIPPPDVGWEVVTEALTADRSRQPRSMSASDISSGIGVGILLLLLVLQWGLFNRAELAADAGWRPVLEQLCEILPCELPFQMDVARVEILDRDVRNHPVVEDALLINVAFANRAEFIQPYPLLEVSFTDIIGNPVALRRFTPAEYLGEHVELAAGMPTGVPVQVVLEVRDPGDEAVSFQFDFL